MSKNEKYEFMKVWIKKNFPSLSASQYQEAIKLVCEALDY